MYKYLLMLLVGCTLNVLAFAQVMDNTCFQEAAPYSPATDSGADVAIVYGTHKGFDERVAQWRDKGYTVSMMTGISWGRYADYFVDADGKLKVHEIQTEKDGTLIMHGPEVGYNVPSPDYIEYIKQRVEPAIEAEVRGIYLEEPEFWARAGWSNGFKKEYERYYSESWRAPDSSPDAQYRVSRLKYELYFDALKGVFEHIKQRAEEKGITIECHVPTHSLINYASWSIVSPESHLADLPEFDGYIAQVWTGTARTVNTYKGVRAERTFETAFCEYGQMLAMVRPTGRKVWFLHDPIEDNPNKSWADYRRNYEYTLTASLLWPEVHRYEIMPWPGRIFKKRYALTDADIDGGERVGIPEDYARELMTIFNALNDMDQSVVDYDAGTRGIGVLVSDTLMFQRAQPKSSDRAMGHFFGLSLPLIKAGIPVEVMQLENTTVAGALDRYKVLLLTYEGQKPLKPAYHEALAAWVNQGGTLLYVDDGKDPYHHVREWWNDQGATKALPADHLFALLKVNPKQSGLQPVGKGFVHIIPEAPSRLTRSEAGARKVLNAVKGAVENTGNTFHTQNYIKIRRGPYLVVMVLTESMSDAPLELEGAFLNLFDADLDVHRKLRFSPGQCALLYDLDWAKTHLSQPRVAAAGTRVRDQKVSADRFEFRTRGPVPTRAHLRVMLPAAPKSVTLDPLAPVEQGYDPESQTLLLKFDNMADDVKVTIVR